MTPEKWKDPAGSRYARSPNGREQKWRYDASPLGQENYFRYRHSPKGLATTLRFYGSPLYKEGQRRYAQSDKGRVTHAARDARYYEKNREVVRARQKAYYDRTCGR